MVVGKKEMMRLLEPYIKGIDLDHLVADTTYYTRDGARWSRTPVPVTSESNQLYFTVRHSMPAIMCIKSDNLSIRICGASYLSLLLILFLDPVWVSIYIETAVP